MSKGDVVVSEVQEASVEVVDALRFLIPQLSSSSSLPTMAEVSEMAGSDAIRLLIARDGSGPILGSLTLVVFRIPTGVRAWIEDVVVDSEARGMGVGALLVNDAIARATAEGAKTVDLTSRPSREEANRLYLRLGFEHRHTNIYRFDCHSS
jgi:ribosomal protein S18 acetylase RimI-like enzyme